MAKLREILSGAGNGISRTDDIVQSLIRDHLLRLPKEGRLPQDARMGGVREFLGSAIHHSADPTAKTAYRVGNDPMDQYGIYGARALQAGGLTAAGIGALNLTTAIGNAFGGPADETPPDTLPM